MNYIIKTNLKGGWQTIKFNDYDQYIQKWQQLKENGDIYENDKPIVRFNQKGGNGNIYFLIKIPFGVGLNNFANTCWANSFIQIIINSDKLTEHFKKDTFISKTNRKKNNRFTVIYDDVRKFVKELFSKIEVQIQIPNLGYFADSAEAFYAYYNLYAPNVLKFNYKNNIDNNFIEDIEKKIPNKYLKTIEIRVNNENTCTEYEYFFKYNEKFFKIFKISDPDEINKIKIGKDKEIVYYFYEDILNNIESTEYIYDYEEDDSKDIKFINRELEIFVNSTSDVDISKFELIKEKKDVKKSYEIKYESPFIELWVRGEEDSLLNILQQNLKTNETRYDIECDNNETTTKITKTYNKQIYLNKTDYLFIMIERGVFIDKKRNYDKKFKLNLDETLNIEGNIFVLYGGLINVDLKEVHYISFTKRINNKYYIHDDKKHPKEVTIDDLNNKKDITFLYYEKIEN